MPEKRGLWWHKVLSYWPLILALSCSTAFGSYTWFLATQVTKQDGVWATRYAHFLQGRPNELGDTLAGFVGSLTLVWVVASVIQQSMELRAQRREFVEMVRAQEAQVLALNAQALIFADERKQRDEKRAEELLNELLKSILQCLDQFSKMNCVVRYVHTTDVDGTLTIGAVRAKLFPKCTSFQYDRDLHAIMSDIDGTILDLDMGTLKPNGPLSGRFAFLGKDLLDFIGYALSIEDSLSAAQKQRLRSLELRRLDKLTLEFLKRLTYSDDAEILVSS